MHKTIFAIIATAAALCAGHASAQYMPPPQWPQPPVYAPNPPIVQMPMPQPMPMPRQTQCRPDGFGGFRCSTF